MLLSSLPQALFSPKIVTPGLDKPCCCYPACRRRFFRRKWPTLDFTCPVAANHLAAGAFFSVKMTTPGFDKPCCCYPACRRRFFSLKMTICVFDKPCCCYPACRRRFCFCENDQPLWPVDVHGPKPFHGDSELATVNREQNRRSHNIDRWSFLICASSGPNRNSE